MGIYVHRHLEVVPYSMGVCVCVFRGSVPSKGFEKGSPKGRPLTTPRGADTKGFGFSSLRRTDNSTLLAKPQ